MDIRNFTKCLTADLKIHPSSKFKIFIFLILEYSFLHLLPIIRDLYQKQIVNRHMIDRFFVATMDYWKVSVSEMFDLIFFRRVFGVCGHMYFLEFNIHALSFRSNKHIQMLLSF